MAHRTIRREPSSEICTGNADHDAIRRRKQGERVGEFSVCRINVEYVQQEVDERCYDDNEQNAGGDRPNTFPHINSARDTLRGHVRRLLSRSRFLCNRRTDSSDRIC